MKETILMILTGLFAGTNILQFLFLKSSKTKAQAEAESATLDNQQKALDIRQDAMKGIQQQCDDMMTRMLGMQAELQKYMMEVAELRAMLVVRDRTIDNLTQERDHYKLEYEKAELELISLRKHKSQSQHEKV